MPNIFCLSHSTTSVNNPRGDNNDKNDNIKAKNNNKNDNNGSDYKIKDNSDVFDFKINWDANNKTKHNPKSAGNNLIASDAINYWRHAN